MRPAKGKDGALHSARTVPAHLLQRSQSKTSDEMASMPLDMVVSHKMTTDGKEGDASYEASLDNPRRRTIGFLAEHNRQNTFDINNNKELE